jgi:hypothetical protein
MVEGEPDMPAGEIGTVLEEADLIVTAAGPEIVAEFEQERATRRWWQVWKRKSPGDLGLSSR